jgi:hypothetical protein
MRILLTLLVPLLFSGCVLSESKQYTPLSPEEIASLEPGVSTASDVVMLLGAPTEIVQLGKRSAYRYDHTVEKQTGLFLILVALRGVDAQQDRAWFFFDEEQTLTHIGASFEAELADYSLPGFGG